MASDGIGNSQLQQWCGLTRPTVGVRSRSGSKDTPTLERKTSIGSRPTPPGRPPRPTGETTTTSPPPRKSFEALKNETVIKLQEVKRKAPERFDALLNTTNLAIRAYGSSTDPTAKENAHKSLETVSGQIAQVLGTSPPPTIPPRGTTTSPPPQGTVTPPPPRGTTTTPPPRGTTTSPPPRGTVTPPPPRGTTTSPPPRGTVTPPPPRGTTTSPTPSPTGPLNRTAPPLKSPTLPPTMTGGVPPQTTPPKQPGTLPPSSTTTGGTTAPPLKSPGTTPPVDVEKIKTDLRSAGERMKAIATEAGVRLNPLKVELQAIVQLVPQPLKHGECNTRVTKLLSDIGTLENTIAQENVAIKDLNKRANAAANKLARFQKSAPTVQTAQVTLAVNGLPAIRNFITQRSVTNATNALVLIEQQIVNFDTLAKQAVTQQVTDAKLKLKNFNPEDPTQKNAIRAQAQVAATDVLKDIQVEIDQKDDIHRKRKYLPDSRDSGYKDDVTKPVQKCLNDIKKVLADPTAISIKVIDTVRALIAQLETPKAHYADKSKFKDSDTAMLEQRDKKVEAITDHQNELRAIVSKLQGLLKLKMQPALDAVKSLSAMASLDPGAANTEKNAIGKMLEENEDLRRGLIDTADDTNVGGLLLAMNGMGTKTQSGCDELVAMRGNDTAFMDNAVGLAIRQEAQISREISGDTTNAKSTFFRANTLGSYLPKAYLQSTPGGKKFLKANHDNIHDRLANYDKDSKVELDPYKYGAPDMAVAQGVIDNPTSRDQERQFAIKQLAEGKEKMKEIGPKIKEAQEEVKSLVESLAKDVVKSLKDIPPELTKIAAEFYQQALLASDGDEDFATTQVGGFISLRLVNPMMAAGFFTETNEKYQDPKTSEDEKKDIEGQRRAGVLASKVIQNISNGVEFSDKGKEGYMAPMNDMVSDGKGGYSKVAQEFRNGMKEVAERGMAMGLPRPTFDAIMGNSKGKKAFRDYLVKLMCEENLDFYEIASKNPTGPTAQKCYDDYLSNSAAIVQVNLDDGGLFNKFHAANVSKDWASAPWSRAADVALANMRNDSYHRLTTPEREADMNCVKVAMR